MGCEAASVFRVLQVKNLPTMRETQVRSLGQEDPLEKEMATHCSTLAWRIPWTEGPGGAQSMGSQRVNMTKQLDNKALLKHWAERPEAGVKGPHGRWWTGGQGAWGS